MFASEQEMARFLTVEDSLQLAVGGFKTAIFGRF